MSDPIGLLPPGEILLGVNKRGVHFYLPVPKECLHSALLEDIELYGSIVAVGSVNGDIGNNLKESLNADKQSLEEVTCECDRLSLRSTCNEKDNTIQAATLEKRNMEVRLTKLNNLVLEESVEANNQNSVLAALKSQGNDLEKKLEGFRQELAAVESALSVKDADLVAQQNNLRELDELREMKEDIDRKNEQRATILRMQGAQLAEMEALYKE
ncbi:hypothetical protein K1719_015104 [Acacia pycnantha]|nr:hypothetical protein K1719_015104 [Acacia pycnantha]